MIVKSFARLLKKAGETFTLQTVLYSGRYGNMSSHTSTVALAIMATVSRLLPRNAKIKAEAKPSAALMALPVAVRIAGKVMAESVAYGT